MKNILRLSLKMLRRNRLLNTYIILQMAVVFSMTVFMVSSITTRFRYYEPFREYTDKNGWLIDHEFTFIDDAYAGDPELLSKYLKGVETEDIHTMYNVFLPSEADSNVTVLTAYAYDKDFVKKWKPKMSDGKWLSEAGKASSGAIPVVMYDSTGNVKVGDVLKHNCTLDLWVGDNGEIINDTKYFEYEFEVIGLLDKNSEVVYFNIGDDLSYKNIYSTPDYISSSHMTSDIYLFRYEDLSRDKYNVAPMGCSFITVSDTLTAEEMQKNEEVIRKISGHYIRLSDYRENSMKFITSDIKKLLPIFVCILILTLMITVSVNAITTYKEIKNYALYYICGMTWKGTMLISLCHAFLQAVFSAAIAALAIIICSALDLFSGTVIELSALQFFACIALIVADLIFAVIMPLLIIQKSTPKEILTSN